MPKGRFAREKSLVGATSSQDDGGAERLVDGTMVVDVSYYVANGFLVLGVAFNILLRLGRTPRMRHHGCGDRWQRILGWDIAVRRRFA
jgi:hypothetical protein